ncbi:DUF6933 domain-containing protein [Paremcibacter congregatus]|uniref:DUF6933 domain-containing protein n=1 Tax=Paremcibacter congregatus TaxID=2043170 RepID=UPI003A910452
MLHFHLTQKLAKATGSDLAPVPEDLAALDAWYVNRVKIHGFGAFLIFTQRDSLFSILLDAPPRQPFFKSVDRFKDRLTQLTGRDLYADSPTFITCKTNSRSVLGCMNDFAFILKFEVHRQYDASRSVDLGIIETTINNMPITPLGPDYASERFEKLVAEQYG